MLPLCTLLAVLLEARLDAALLAAEDTADEAALELARLETALLAAEDATLELLEELPQLLTTSAASFSPLPGPAAASAMHLAFRPG